MRGALLAGLVLLVWPSAAFADSGWTLTATKPAGAAAPYLGNGYVGTRVGTGETHIAGVYADVPDPITGGTQHEGSFAVPDWTQLDVVVDGHRFAERDATRFRQVLDLRRGIVTTTATWRGAQLRFELLLDRADERVGLVRVRVTPPAGAHVSVRAGGGRVVRTKGTETTVAEAVRVQRVRAGRTYTVSKVVGFATSLDSRSPLVRARRAAQADPSAILDRHVKAWARLWTADIIVPGQPRLQRRLRAAMFYLLASARQNVDRSISPVGLSSGGYNDHVFWDAETWMYPALLAQHPGEASTVTDYRLDTLAGARRNALSTGYSGARFAWESALSGNEVTPEWAETGHLEQHITADVALAQWQRYLTTGDREWLRLRGWPVIAGAADFWASRAAGGHITNVEGPDEQNWPVDDSTYTNATAVMTLRIAARAAQILGLPVPPQWTQVAESLTVLEPQPFRPEFAGYNGQDVKQADVVLLTYPWEFPQAAAVDRANLDYYTPRYDPDGPAMTDSVSSIVAAQLGGDCSAWTYTRRSLDPFVKPPFEQFTEARSGQGVFTFLTGEGGFLQEFLYGYTGLRWREGAVRLDPFLPPQLAGGLRITGLRWQGRRFDVDVRPSGATVTLREGPPMPIEGHGTVVGGTPLTLPVRGARCPAASANSADPSAPADAAVDGSLVTAWQSGADPATPSTLTVRASGTISHATLTWDESRPLAPYLLQAHVGGAWRTVARIQGTGDTDTVTFAPVAADAVRLRIPATRRAGENPRLAEFAVSN